MNAIQYIYGGLTPRFTQDWGARPEFYAQFGMDGHNGLDYVLKHGTPIYSHVEGEAVFSTYGGYGMHYRIYEKTKIGFNEWIFAHFSILFPTKYVKIGQKIGSQGNTGISTGSHLHLGLRPVDKNKKPLYYSNGYKGWIDPKATLNNCDFMTQNEFDDFLQNSLKNPDIQKYLAETLIPTNIEQVWDAEPITHKKYYDMFDYFVSPLENKIKKIASLAFSRGKTIDK